ncbi:MAG TPA: ABC transporter permease, partial [Longimicrobiales bacterium]|nr:ABC transporter permease [Longimicrobiales bacterium]
MNYRRWFRLRPQSAQDVEREIDDELATHLELRVEELMRKGEPAERARQRALERFGDLSEARRELVADAWTRRQRTRRGEWIEGLRQDFSQAVRRMRAAPGHTLFSLTTLGLAIGLTTATFSLVDGVLLRGLPFRSADRIFSLLSVDSSASAFPLASAGNFADWKAENTTLAAAALHRTTRVTAALGATAVRVTATEALGDFFAVLQTPMRRGRWFDVNEAQAEANVLVVSEAFWRKHLSADPTLSTTVTLGGRPFTVIGIVQAGFEYPAGTDLWVPARYRAFTGAARNNINFMSLARLRDHVTVEQADRDLDRIARRIRESDPAGIYSYGVELRPLKDIMVGGVARYLGILLGAVGFVLLIACANLAGVNLARGAARARELAVRAALGATRARLVRQLLVEQIVVAIVGGAVGVVLAWWAVRAVVGWLGAMLPRGHEVTVDTRILTFALVVAIAAGVVSGIAPALLLSRTGLRERMGGRAVVRGGRNLPGALLVASEVGVALVLLASAGLLIRSYQLLVRRDLGFDPERVVTAEVTLPLNEYRDTANVLRYWERILSGLRAVPGITTAGLANWVPLGDGGRTFIEVEGRAGRQPGAGFRAISDDYFRSLGIRMQQGRDFEIRD